jgi:hypothetical protein
MGVTVYRKIGMSKPLATLGDILKNPEIREKLKPRRRLGDKKRWLDRFAPGTRVRCWWPNASDSSLNGLRGVVRIKRGPIGPLERERKHVILTITDVGSSKLRDRTIDEGHDCWFLTEDEYTLMMVMES